MEEEPPPGVEEPPNVITDEVTAPKETPKADNIASRNEVTAPGTETPNANNITPRSPLKDATPEDVATKARKYRALYEDMKERLGELKKTSECQREDLERQLAEKEAALSELNAHMEENVDPKPKVMRMNNKDSFVSKPRKGTNGESKGCEILGCKNISMDIIKCSMYSNQVCEDCSQDR